MCAIASPIFKHFKLKVKSYLYIFSIPYLCKFYTKYFIPLSTKCFVPLLMPYILFMSFLYQSGLTIYTKYVLYHFYTTRFIKFLYHIFLLLQFFTYIWWIDCFAYFAEKSHFLFEIYIFWVNRPIGNTYIFYRWKIKLQINFAH